MLRLSHGPFLAQPNHGLIVITWALCYSCGHLSYCFCFFSFCAKPSADLELVGLSLSLTTLAGLSDRLSKIPLGRERPQTAICCLEWLGRWKCLATGLDASLSFLSTSRRCSRNRSPSRLPVSPKNFIDDNSALHVLFYDLSTLLQSNRRVTWPTFSQRWYLALAFLIEEVFK